MAIVKKDWGTSTIEGEDVDKGMVDHIYKQIDAIKWGPHPVNENVRMGEILTKRDDNVEISAFKAVCPKGEVVPEHTHPVHDILFPLSGKAKIWIKGLGDFELKKGVVVCVPPGAVHKVYDVTEDLEVYDIFSGPIL
jgi:quercetin dioxygenase-like cupin family protein